MIRESRDESEDEGAMRGNDIRGDFGGINASMGVLRVCTTMESKDKDKGSAKRVQDGRRASPNNKSSGALTLRGAVRRRAVRRSRGRSRGEVLERALRVGLQCRGAFSPVCGAHFAVFVL